MRKKFIIAGWHWQAEDFVRRCNFRVNEFKIAHNLVDILGHYARNVEFILICNYWDNELYKHRAYREYLSQGAIESYPDWYQYRGKKY